MQAWVRGDRSRWWVQFDIHPDAVIERLGIWGPLLWMGPHLNRDEQWGQDWASRRSYGLDQLVSRLADAGYAATVVEEGAGPLPPAWWLELHYGSRHPIEAALAGLLAVVPPERHRRLLTQIAAAVHPDGVEEPPALADELLLLVNRLRDDVTRSSRHKGR